MDYHLEHSLFSMSHVLTLLSVNLTLILALHVQPTDYYLNLPAD